MVAISNMDVVGYEPSDIEGYNTTVFRESVPMSTYLVAFLVSDFSFTANSKDISKYSQIIHY